MTKKQKKMLLRILVSAALMVGLLFVPATGWLRFALWLVSGSVLNLSRANSVARI